MQLHGDWPDAVDAARRACERLSEPRGHAAAGSAFYQQAELYRLLGRFADAEDAYRRASECGRQPQPGLARLRLAQGKVDAAAGTIRRAVAEAPDRLARSTLLTAYVEIMLAAGEIAGARVAADELTEIAEGVNAALLHAVAAHAQGAVLLAAGDATAALTVLRRSWAAWLELDVPYEGARVRVLLGLACRALADADTAELELDAARRVFHQLGAAPDLARLDKLSPGEPTYGLTPREVQVLRLDAAGRPNRSIAADLVLSEKTVARHVSNILTKLDLPSRSAATAYAFRNDLV